MKQFYTDVTFTYAVTVDGAATFNDSFSISRVGDATAASLLIDTDTTQQAAVLLRTGTSNRWIMGKNAIAESGSNAGSNFYLGAYDDAGIALGDAISIARASQVVNFTAAPTFSQPTTTRNNLAAEHSARPTETHNAAYTLALTDLEDTLYHTGTLGHTWTIPPNSSVAFPLGSRIRGYNLQSGAITLARGAGVSLIYFDGTQADANVTVGTSTWFDLFKQNTDLWFLIGGVNIT